MSFQSIVVQWTTRFGQQLGKSCSGTTAINFGNQGDIVVAGREYLTSSMPAKVMADFDRATGAFHWVHYGNKSDSTDDSVGALYTSSTTGNLYSVEQICINLNRGNIIVVTRYDNAGHALDEQDYHGKPSHAGATYLTGAAFDPLLDNIFTLAESNYAKSKVGTDYDRVTTAYYLGN